MAATVSMIVPVWNGERFLRPCLDAILAQGWDGLEIIAVDNGSQDGSATLIGDHYPLVRLLRNQRNLGFATACNQGARQASGDVLVLLNQDVQLGAGWLAAMLAALSDERVGIAGSKLVYPDGTTIQHAGGYMEMPLWYGRHFGAGEADQGQWDEPRSVPFVTGAALAMRRQLFLDLGLLDEGFYPAYYEDADLCYRARSRGYQVLYVPAARAVHWESSSSARFQLPLVYHRSRLRFVLKHCPPAELADFLVAEEREAPAHSAAGCSRDVAAAYLAALLMAPQLLQERGIPAGHIQMLVHDLARLRQALSHQDAARALDVLVSVPDKGISSRLQEFTFPARTPGIGPVIAWLRRACYGVAAKWAVRYLIQQGNEIIA
ncbi:MAG: glycosyltransferase family 2 protein, partial [Anaerolineae bacterium]